MTVGTIGGPMRIAAGDLTVRIDTTREDDVGRPRACNRKRGACPLVAPETAVLRQETSVRPYVERPPRVGYGLTRDSRRGCILHTSGSIRWSARRPYTVNYSMRGFRLSGSHHGRDFADRDRSGQAMFPPARAGCAGKEVCRKYLSRSQVHSFACRLRSAMPRSKSKTGNAYRTGLFK